ncbi:hypothetical protein IU473_22205 [Nocardia farcinica]|nr:hypothetical protein [Nocardia farcinica]
MTRSALEGGGRWNTMSAERHSRVADVRPDPVQESRDLGATDQLQGRADAASALSCVTLPNYSAD